MSPSARYHERHNRYTYEEYLEHERSSNVKHEFLDGDIFAMAGGSLNHAALSLAAGAELLRQLKGGTCVVYNSDLKVRSVATGLATYPDVTIVCGKPETDPKSDHVVLNPTVVVEVTSPGTEEWDRGEKLDHYKTIPSLRECVLVSHRKRSIEVVRREADGSWSRQEAGPGQSLKLAAVDASLVTDEIYAGIQLS